MTKREHGMGSVTEYRPGHWQLKYTTATGERRSKAGFESKKAAEAALAAAITDVVRGDYFDERKGRTPFGVIAREHIKMADLRPRTRANYLSLLRTALSGFDVVPVGDITVLDVDRWWASLAAHQVNRRNAYFLMRATMKSAQRWGYVRSNPCLIDGAGKDVARIRPTWTTKQYEAALAYLRPDFHAPIVVMFAGHLRVGELVGLNASDYDRASGRLTISKQGEGEKTKTGQHRTVRLLSPGIEAMADHLDAAPRIGSAPLFGGERRISRTALRRAWAAACAEAGLDDFHLHDLRHLGLTEVARVVKNPKDIQARAGHASLTSSMRYLHTDEERDAEVADLTSARLARRRRA